MPSWTYDESSGEEGVAHESIPNTDHVDATTIIQGYDYEDFSEIGPDPVACWPLHEDSGSTAYDVAGSNDGTVNGATLGETGILGTSAYRFDGTDDNVRLGSGFGDTLFTSGNPWTVVVVANRSRGSNQLAFDHATTGVSVGFEQQGSDGAEASIFDGSRVGPITSGNTASRVWKHHALVYKGSSTNEIEYYLNGTSQGAASGGPPSMTRGNATIGSRGDGSFNDWNGLIGGVWVYDAALTAAEVQTHSDVLTTDGDWLSTGKSL